VFNKGTGEIDYNVSPDEPWIKVVRTKGSFSKDERLLVTIDWNNLQQGRNNGKIKISGTGREVNVGITAFKPEEITAESLKGFIEGEGVVSIEAEHFTNNFISGGARWIKVEDYGHTLSAMRADVPVDNPPVIPGKDSPHLEYQMYLFSSGTIDVTAIFSPTLNFATGRGQNYGISFDDHPPQIVTLVPENYNAMNGNTDWEKTVSDNARFSKTSHSLLSPGYHILKIWLIDPGPAIQKIIVNTGGLRSSYMGPPESYKNK
jgi:hypothetical protein